MLGVYVNGPPARSPRPCSGSLVPPLPATFSWHPLKCSIKLCVCGGYKYHLKLQDSVCPNCLGTRELSERPRRFKVRRNLGYELCLVTYFLSLACFQIVTLIWAFFFWYRLFGMLRAKLKCSLLLNFHHLFGRNVYFGRGEFTSSATTRWMAIHGWDGHSCPSGMPWGDGIHGRAG